jgi:predicted site-specific integrase-resolvase
LTSRHFRKKKTFLKDKIDALAMSSMKKNISDLYRGINYQHRCNLVKDENDDLLADFHDILNMWKKYFSQILNAHGASDVKQIEVHTAERKIPDPNPLQAEIAIAKLKGVNRHVVIKLRRTYSKRQLNITF